MGRADRDVPIEATRGRESQVEADRRRLVARQGDVVGRVPLATDLVDQLALPGRPQSFPGVRRVRDRHFDLTPPDLSNATIAV
jgi:hypothetical protein